MFWTQHRRRKDVVDVVEQLDQPIEPTPGPTSGSTSGPTSGQPTRRGTPTGSPEFVARLKAVLEG